MTFRLPAFTFLLFIFLAAPMHSKGQSLMLKKDYPELVNDLYVLHSFSRQLAKFHEAGDSIIAEDLFKKLAESRNKSLETNEATLAPNMDSTEAALSPTELYKRARESTLIVGDIYKCDKCDLWHSRCAGGVLLSSEGLAITNHHVLAGERSQTFGAMASNGKVYPIVEVLASSKKNDLAIVRLKGTDFPKPAVVGRHHGVGQVIHAITHPKSDFYTYTKGIVARYYLDEKIKAPKMQITADFAAGSSGCGIFNDYGHLVGLVVSTRSLYYNRKPDGTSSNMQMVIKSCTPANEIRRLLKPSAKKRLPTN